MTVYEPREDSELLGDVVKRFARGRALDVGTGSGYLARIAHESGCVVTAFDMNLAAVRALKTAPFRVLHTNSMQLIRGRFDTIICNPPYLPNDKEVFDPALHGGVKGYEYTLQVIADAAHKLRPDGQLLLLISTLTKPVVVEAELRRLGYAFTIVAREKLFMEELLVYRATLVLGRPAELLGEGWRSLVYAVSKTIAVKVMTPERAHKEGVLLRAANKVGVGPKLLKVTGGHVWMRRVYGERFDEFFRRERDMRVAKRVLAQCRALDKAGITKRELQRPAQNILVTRSRSVVFIDFERSVFSPTPNNVIQFAGFLANVLSLDVQRVAREYKRNSSEQNCRALLRALGL
jgi:release factor glutamine methyltransferase